MKRAALVFALGLAACGKKESPQAEKKEAAKESVAKSEEVRPKVPKPPAKVRVEEPPEAPYVPIGPHEPPPPDPIAPILGLSANGSDVAELPPGWPLILRLRLHPCPQGPVRFPAKDGSWANLVTIDAGPLPLKPGPKPEGHLALENGHSGELVWTVSAAELDTLPRGPLRISATIDTFRTSAQIKLVGPPKDVPRLDPRRVGIDVEFALARGEPAAAVSAVEAGLKLRSNEPYLLTLHAETLAAAGRREDAVKACARAIEEAVVRRRSTRGLQLLLESLSK